MEVLFADAEMSKIPCRTEKEKKMSEKNLWSGLVLSAT